MVEIWLAATLWVVTHLGLSSTPLRGALVGVVGEKGFAGVYSLVAFASLGFLIWVYGTVPRFDYFWLPNPDLYWVAKVTMPIALILMLGGFMVRNPTMVGATLDDAGAAAAMATGVTRITRHPFQWAVVIWGVGHIVANGDQVSVVFFSAFVLVSLAGTFLMDMKKRRSFGDAWSAYAGVTSNVPFAALMSGRNQLVLKELWLPVAVGLVAYALLYYFHEALFGALIV